MAGNTSLLLITADEPLAKEVCEFARHYVLVRWIREVGTVLSAAPPALGWCGLIFDLDSTRGDPFEVVKRVRGTRISLPALGITAYSGADIVNAAHAARVEIVIRPFAPANLAGFVHRLIVGENVPDERVRAWIADQASNRKLKPREVQLIADALGGKPRTETSRRLGITQNTLKTHVRALLHKFHARNMDDLVKIALREAFLTRGGNGQ